MHDLTGQTLSSFHMKDLLFQGPLTDTYRAEVPETDNQVAVEVFRHPVEEDHLLDLFRSETAAVPALDHPHILKTLSFGDLDGRPYVVTAYVEGMPLSTKLRELSSEGYLYPLHFVVQLIQDLTSALSIAHSSDILHMGLNPSAILLRTSSAAKDDPAPALPFDLDALISAYGIASLFAPLRERDDASARLSLYLSPEQLRGDSLNPGTDLYALAALTVELLAGRPPAFPGHVSLASAQLASSDVRLPSIPHMHVSLHEVLAQALSARPEDRYPSPTEFANAFAAAAKAARAPTTAPFRALYARQPQTYGAPATPPRRRTRNRWMLAALLVTAAFILLILGYLAWRILVDLGFISNGRFLPVTSSIDVLPIFFPISFGLHPLLRRLRRRRRPD